MIRVKLKEFLDTHDLSAYRLGQEVEGIHLKTVQMYASGARQPQLDSLDKVIRALRDLTGEAVEVGDLLEYTESETAEDAPRLTAVGVPYTGDPETDAVLDEHPDILERIRKLEAGEAKLIPWEQVKAEQRAKRGL